MALKLPTAELVAVAYAKAVLSLAGQTTVPVVTKLPDVSTWVTTGAVQVESIVGTTVRDTNLRDLIVSYGGWAARPDSDKPPYGQANGLLEFIRESAFWDWAEAALPLDLAPAATYHSVLVQGAHPQTEPRRIPDQDTSRAHYSMDFRLMWTVREED